jgi:hypothetical protein
MGLVAKIEEGGESRVDLDPDIAAVAAVAAVRSAEGDIFFAAEGKAAAAAVAGFDENLDFIYELHGSVFSLNVRTPWAGTHMTTGEDSLPCCIQGYFFIP